MKRTALTARRGRPQDMALALALAMSALFAAGQASAATPAVGTRVETVVQPLEPTPGVVESYVSVYSPLPASAGARPEACDWVSYLRFRDQNGPADSSSADAVYTAMPGFMAGANWFEILARNTVKNSAASGKHVEFWVNARRSTCLVDHVGLDAAVAAKDYHVAVNYYYKGKPINGKTFAGFPNWSQVRFLSALDAGQTVNDWYTLISNGIPDPAVRARKLLCGGHSYGGPITGTFTAWGLGSNPTNPINAGYQQCAGFFAVDSILSSDPADLNGKPVLGGLVGAITGAATGLVQAANSLGIAPDMDFGLVLTPETWNMLSIVGLAAYFQPDQESDLLRILPHDINLDLTFHLFLSRTYGQFLTNLPDVRSFRYTNAALLGALMDNNTQIVSLIQQSIGSFGGGPVGTKTFPLPEQIDDIPLVGHLLASALSPGVSPKVGPTDPNALYTWNNYNATPGTMPNGSAYTSKSEEVTDIREYARSLFEGPASFFDAFMSTSTVVGVGAGLASADANFGPFQNMLYPTGILQKPRAWVFGSDDGVYAAESFIDPFLGLLNPGNPLVPSTSTLVPNYTHPDMVTAAAAQNDGKPEQVSQFLINFANQTVH